MPTLEISAPVVAWYAAIVATASLVVTGYAMIRDRPRVVVRISPNMEVFPKSSPEDERLLLMVTVANAGRRPITITHVWLEKGKAANPKLLLKQCLLEGPRELGEGKAVSYQAYQDQVDGSWSHVCVSDSAGREFRRRIPRTIRRVLDQARRGGVEHDG